MSILRSLPIVLTISATLATSISATERVEGIAACNQSGEELFVAFGVDSSMTGHTSDGLNRLPNGKCLTAFQQETKVDIFYIFATDGRGMFEWYAYDDEPGAVFCVNYRQSTINMNQDPKGTGELICGQNSKSKRFIAVSRSSSGIAKFVFTDSNWSD